MKKLAFEYRFIIVYLLMGGLWILFSDALLNAMITDPRAMTRMQTGKGWFYVLLSGILFFMYLKIHLDRLRAVENELQNHRDRLNDLVTEKTQRLDKVIEELSLKNETIKQQNEDLKRVLKNLNSMQTQFFQTEKMASLGVLTAGIAHEINNPLNYILGGITGLELYFEEEKIKTENTDLFLTSIRTGVERVTAIVSGLNQMSRNRDTLEEDCDLHMILGNCLMILGNELKHRIEVIEHYENARIIVPGNVGKLHQVFINILINASQSISSEGQIIIATQLIGQNVEIRISDTGCGIPSANLKKLTEPFFTTKNPGEGTGLGLSISYNIIQEHKGQIHFESEQEKGTTVTITLPVLKIEK
jgi:C4-dicarboxylate-specific signal transduction histidine kinase